MNKNTKMEFSVFLGVATVVLVALLLLAPAAHAERIKDLASVAGIRDNQLVGYGLIVGLDGTGDQTGQAPFTVQSLKSMLKRFGVTVPDNVNPALRSALWSALWPALRAAGMAARISPAAMRGSQVLRARCVPHAPMPWPAQSVEI